MSLACSDPTSANDRGRPVRCCGDRGATAVEYGLMVALIALVIVGAVAVFGLNLGELYDDVAASLPSV